MVDPKSQKEIVRILSEIFPGVAIYYFGTKAKAHDANGKEPEIDIALDLARRIGNKDIAEAQKALAETNIPYTIYLYDLNSVSEHERKEINKKAIAWRFPL